MRVIRIIVRINFRKKKMRTLTKAKLGLVMLFMASCGNTTDKTQKPEIDTNSVQENTTAVQKNSANIVVNTPAGLKAEFDCSCFHVEDNKLWMTGEAVEKIDEMYSGAKVKRGSLIYKKDLSLDSKTRGNQLSMNLYQLLNHVARFHDDCVSQTAKYEIAVSKQNGRVFNADGVYGEGWQDKESCFIADLRDACKDKLNLD